jgi:hypothetical protein
MFTSLSPSFGLFFSVSFPLSLSLESLRISPSALSLFHVHAFGSLLLFLPLYLSTFISSLLCVFPFVSPPVSLFFLCFATCHFSSHNLSLSGATLYAFHPSTLSPLWTLLLCLFSDSSTSISFPLCLALCPLYVFLLEYFPLDKFPHVLFFVFLLFLTLSFCLVSLSIFLASSPKSLPLYHSLPIFSTLPASVPRLSFCLLYVSPSVSLLFVFPTVAFSLCFALSSSLYTPSVFSAIVCVSPSTVYKFVLFTENLFLSFSPSFIVFSYPAPPS